MGLQILENEEETVKVDVSTVRWSTVTTSTSMRPLCKMATELARLARHTATPNLADLIS